MGINITEAFMFRIQIRTISARYPLLHGVDDVFAVLSCYAVYVGSSGQPNGPIFKGQAVQEDGVGSGSFSEKVTAINSCGKRFFHLVLFHFLFCLSRTN